MEGRFNRAHFALPEGLIHGGAYFQNFTVILQKKFKKCEDFLTLHVLLLPQKHNKNKAYLLPDSQLTVDCRKNVTKVVLETIHNIPPPPTPMEGTFNLDHPRTPL